MRRSNVRIVGGRLSARAALAGHKNLFTGDSSKTVSRWWQEYVKSARDVATYQSNWLVGGRQDDRV